MPWANTFEEQEDDLDDYSSYADSGESDAERQAEEAPQTDLTDDENSNDNADASDEDSDIDADVGHAHGPRTTSEKRRAQNELFRAFVAGANERITEELNVAIQGVHNDVLSIRDILAKQENSAKITNPRDYQTELFQRAKEENIIAVLGTGSGKTHIATLLLRHILDLELEARAKGARPRIAFFLVNSVNLVFQQANVLRCGLDQRVEGICGAMGASLWQKPTWDKHFADNMVIVCTAAVLEQCMMHSFITMAQVNLLIFDEAHHAKNNHPYAQLMKEFYLNEPDVSKRPRVFGMTASPVDANTSVRDAAMKLEKMLHCKIATTSDVTLLANSINKPFEQVVEYPRLPVGLETPFYQEMKARYGGVSAFQKFFKTSKDYSSVLGKWAADMYWSLAFTEHESRKRELRQEFRYHKTKKDGPVEELNEAQALLREAAEFVRQHDFGVPTPTAQDLSSKVLELLWWLNQYYNRHGNHRCIVFVEQRQTARLLNYIFGHIGGPHLRGDVLIGSGSYADEQHISLRSQILTVTKFRQGELNCLFATSVAEEGLDIPQCNLVVRFDLYRTMIGYVQSRGRARHQNSKYLHMVEQDNSSHKALLCNARNAETVMKGFCEGLSGDRVLNELDSDVATYLDAEEEYRTYIDPETGAKLTYRSSLSVLAHFVASLPAPNQEVCLQATYVMSHVDLRHDRSEIGHRGFQCEVILPECSPIISAIGQPRRRKAIAKCSAAFEMCLKLRENDFLDANLLPIYTKQLPAMRNAQLAISEKKKDLYPMRVKPDFWQIGYDTIPKCLYLTVVDVDAGLERPHQPLGLLTRVPFPQLPKFPIYLKDDRPSNVISIPLKNHLQVTNEDLGRFTTFFLQIFEDIFAKLYEHDVLKMSYWIVPIRHDKISSITQLSKPEDVIDLKQVFHFCEEREQRWTPEMDTEELVSKYIVDRGDGGRRFYSIAIEPELKPEDPVPSTAPAYKYSKDILDYSVSLWKKQRELHDPLWDRSQPVMKVEKIPFRRNLLAKVETGETGIKGGNIAYICPEPFRVSTLSVPFVAMCYIFPAVIHRFEDYLVSLEACKVLQLNVGPGLALEALTKDSENSDEHGEEKINFKSGMGPNYERLEFMGDCFLKMATSISTFVLQPDENEFEFHVRRMLMLCNKNLFNTALKLNLVDYIRTESFSRRLWYPKLRLLRGKGMKNTGNDAIKHRLGDKSIADVCEAFIGAAFMEHNKQGIWDPKHWDEAVKAVTVLVNSEDHEMRRFSDYYAKYVKPKYQVAKATANQQDLAEKVEKKHPYHFQYPRLLRSAFIHPSQAFMWENIPNYQRLEFLGDALLDQAFIMYLFYRYPGKDPAWLTEHKMPMVSNKFLGAVCVKVGFHQHIRQNNAMLSSQIRDYVNEVTEAEREANGAVDYWSTVSEPPKCLADVVEAYVAAMFVDSEFDFSVVQKFFDMHLKPFFLDMSIYDSFANNHPTTRLSKLLQINFGCREWRMATHTQKSILPGDKDKVLAMIMIHNKVHFHGVAVSGRYARVKASHAALEKLDGLPEFEYRRTYGCDCEEDLVCGDAQGLDTEEALIEKMGANI